MKVTTIPWSRDIPRSTSERAEGETWAYWQNKINRASLVMLHDQGILGDEVCRTIARAHRHAEEEQAAPGAAPVQDIMSCIGTAIALDDWPRKKMTGTEFYMKSEAEMRELFSWCPEVIDSTFEVASKCNYELDWSSMYLPKFPFLEEGETSEERFRKECEIGLARRYGED